MSQSLNRYYHGELAGLAAGDVVSLDPAEAKHLMKVRRARSGTEVELFDGAGIVAIGSLLPLGRRQPVKLRIESMACFAPPMRSLEVACAVPKGERIEVMLDMLTQVGVDVIHLLEFEHSVRKPGDNRFQRWQRILLEACKQCRRPHAPVLNLPLSLDQWLEREVGVAGCLRILADPDGEAATRLSSWLAEPGLSRIVVVIGPEGGISGDESERLNTSGFRLLRLGPAIMRIETAAVALAAAIQANTPA